MPKRKVEPDPIPTFEHLNPDYQARPIAAELPAPKTSTSSVHWRNLTPEWLLREYLNRSNYGGISSRIRNVRLDGDTWWFDTNLAPPREEPVWKSYSISQRELEVDK